MMRISCLLLFAILLLPMLAMLAGCNDEVKKSTTKALPEIQVQTETLALMELASRVEFVGTLQAAEEATLAARVSGQIVELPVRVGSKVNQGDLLVKINAAEIAAKLSQAETRLAQARRNLARETALLKLDASTREAVKTLEEQVQISKAVYREAKTMLDYTQVKAPFTGTVTGKLAEVGDLATPGVPLLQLESSNPLEVVVQITEALVQSLHLDTSLPVSVPAAGLEFAAQVLEIAPIVDPASRTIRVKLAMPDNPALRSGQFARVSLTDAQLSALMIDRRAVRQKGQMTQVFVVEQGKARMRLVRIGISSGDRVEILSGLQAGDQVVVSPVDKVLDGQPVVVVKTGARE